MVHVFVVGKMICIDSFTRGGTWMSFDLVWQASDTPAVGSLVDGIHNVGIQGLTLLDEQNL